MLLSLVLWSACGGPSPSSPDGPEPTSGVDSGPAPTSSPSTGSTPATDLHEVLAARGYQVGEGDFVFSTMDGCCDPGANCWGNNPSTPYGTHAVPPAPGADPRDDALLEAFGDIEAGLSRDFLMRPDEALVWLGTVPPEARYFGFRSYLGERPGADHYVIGSLGPSLNHQVLESSRGEAPWGQPLAVVTTADAVVEAEVIDALVASGWERRHIEVDRLPPDLVNLGLDPAVHDTLFTLARVAVYADPAAGAAWEADPGVVLRLTPEVERPLEAPHPLPALPSRGDGIDEASWHEAWFALGEGVHAALGHPDGVLQSVVPYWAETLDCIDSGRSCTGDIRDRYVGISPYFGLPTPESYLVAFGVNHQRTGSASYSSVSIQTIANQRGVASFDSDAMVGSARGFVDHALVDDLYVVVFARDCARFDAACIEVPWECPGGGMAETFKITGRAYLEPTTGAAPLPEEMLDDMVYLVVPGNG